VQSKYKAEYFDYREVMIPMRDGVRLQTVLRMPKNFSGPLPFLFVRSPYQLPIGRHSGITYPAIPFDQHLPHGILQTPFALIAVNDRQVVAVR
jgi:predicted acyl esterase